TAGDLKNTSGHPLIAAALREQPPASLKDMASVYGTVLQKYDRAQPNPDAAEEQLRAVLRGPKSPADVPLDEFELIYSEGDGNNTRSLEVRYNVMLAQYAYDGAPPRAMAMEDVPK